ncbi:MAG: histidine phosphatase family protein [Planctomycetes bacterium]|nr:histidine phosphatase family protein [Planctomycetota bacterium]
MVNLVLIRHAEAINRGILRRDAARPLTPAGRRRFARSVEGLRRLGLRFDLVLHSPWLRAVETADLLAPIVRGEFAVTRNLSTRPSEALLAELRSEAAAALADDRSVAVVGHEPWLSELASRLVTGSPAHARAE